ncbi:uncharacterized protein LOC123011943 [Tribolium madens]|uniref:uncharacterized protein LOC123011943 n=1 Tax=Tribolium madens TaxID=41895 RepID=UPI001CF72DA4|nr:uncharacterized protein LOC123011943 [Tribolium madens]
MDELSNKLNSRNPIVAIQIASKLAKIVKNRQSDDILDVPEFKFLKENCLNGNILAAKAILQIVEGAPNLAKSLITDFITLITTTRFSPNVAFLINHLLMGGNEHKSYNMQVPQHPFLVMLKEDPNSWRAIFRELSFSYRENPKTISHYNELHKAVFLFVLCDPNGGNFPTFKQKLWNFVIKNNTELINCLLSWMQFENKDTIEINSEFLGELLPDVFPQDLLILWQISSLSQLIKHNYDPREIIYNISETLDKVTNLIILNPILLILSKSINLCSGVFLLPLLQLIKLIIVKSQCDLITSNVIKSVLLQWMSSPSDLISDNLKLINEIFALLETDEKNLTRLRGFTKLYKNHQNLIITNSDVYFSLQTYIILEQCRNLQDLVVFLDKLGKTPDFFLLKFYNFLLGLFLTEFETPLIASKVFDLLLKCTFLKSSNLLTVILYKLTKTTDSHLHLKLLKALPKLATKDNLQVIIATIQALNRGPNHLKTFSTSLMFELWTSDNKIYPYLEQLLVAPWQPPCHKSEFYVTRAHILRELCARKPELYGKDMVAHLSRLLNECHAPEGAVAAGVAIEGIRELCKSEIIDAVTTWGTLEPIFRHETRIPVIKSLCGLLGEVPSLSYSDENPEFCDEVVRKLWQFLVGDHEDAVWKGALEALSHFTVEQIVGEIPEDFLDEELSVLRKSGGAIPGTCWVVFLKSCPRAKLHIVGDFLIKLVSIEISQYLKFVYQVKGAREPVDYSYLPVNSVVRGLSSYVKAKVLKWKTDIYKEVYLECLRVLSEEYSKPLPPLDWCFLQELFHEKETKYFCISIAAHQVVLSGTARRFIVNYIEAMDLTKENDVLHIYTHLQHLANSVQPFTLRPFLEKTITTSVDLFEKGNEKQLNEILIHLKNTLRNREIQEANKIVIAQIISDIFAETPITSKLFQVLLDCVVHFPMKCINDLSSPKMVKEIRSEWFKKAIKIRTSLALITQEAPLNLLNDLIEHGHKFPDRNFMFASLTQVFQKHQNNTECVLWLLELLGQIQATPGETHFLSDVFLLATLVFSGHFALDDGEKMYETFPRAIATLLDVNHWSICVPQALEWFSHMSTSQIPNRDVFLSSLKCLRHELEFCKNMKWVKYLNLECESD